MNSRGSAKWGQLHINNYGHDHHITGFNPHLAREPGESFLCGRRVRDLYGFNPHPAREPGESKPYGLRECVPKSFNPHPAREPGESCCLMPAPDIVRSFNPHPAREPGESAGRRLLADRTDVSIRTRPESRVNRL